MDDKGDEKGWHQIQQSTTQTPWNEGRAVLRYSMNLLEEAFQ